jgi:localization factor PodJL
MAPEVDWQASSATTRSGSDVPASDQDTVESLLRRLIKRIEESERRYAEALDELHARLGDVSYTAGVTEAIGTPEETETLERLRLQLSGLARRLEQPPESVAEIERLSPLDKALAEVCAVSAGLAVAEPDWFASPRSTASGPFSEPEPMVSSSLTGSEPSSASPSSAPPSLSDEDADFDRRLIDMAQRLERSLGEAMPSTAIDSLNARMEEISSRFEAALAQAPKLETLQHLERQVADMGQQLGRVEQQIARIGAVEGQLQRLIERFEDTPVQMERAASKAAQETARLVSETGLGKASAAERLDALHRDIVAMNERNLVTGDRLVDTLAAMHESVKGLVQQGERDRASAMVPPPAPPRMEPSPREASPADFAPPEPRVVAPPISAPPTRTTETVPPHGRAKHPFTEQAVGVEAGEPSRRGTLFIRDIPFESTEDLVAAARRAAQAAAARAEERDALRLRQARGADEAKRANEEPGHHKISLLMVVAALLLMISAALLLTRLKLKPDFDVPPPAAEQTVPAPAAEAAPLPGTPLQTEVMPAPEADPVPPPAAVPSTAPGSETLEPAPAPRATPSANPVNTVGPPPVRLGEAAGEAEVLPMSLRSDGGRSLPAGGLAQLGAPPSPLPCCQALDVLS